jgi:hypothetical protein
MKMKNIMVNLNVPIEKDAEKVKMYIAASPIHSTMNFAYDEFRFTIEHHRINDWTLVIEHIETKELELYNDGISTIELGETLNLYLK